MEKCTQKIIITFVCLCLQEPGKTVESDSQVLSRIKSLESENNHLRKGNSSGQPRSKIAKIVQMENARWLLWLPS